MSKLTIGLLLIIFFAGIYVLLTITGLASNLFDSDSLQLIISKAEIWGPLLIVILMASAIVMSPLPSAPIAIASGYVYGHSLGTIYILIGALFGASIAFSMSRWLGFDAMQKRFGNQLNTGWLGSEKHLMLAVGISRLIPFISFDVISYAAGLTRMSYLQFAVATLIGIIPASFLLAHFGGEIADSDLLQITITVVLLGGMTTIPIVIAIIRKNYF